MSVNSFDDYKMNWRPILRESNVPIYKRLFEQMKEDIKKGILKPGDKMPPQRELADFLNLNLSTITRTYDLGEKCGLLTAHVGKGTFVAMGVNISEKLLMPQNEDYIHLDTMIPPYNCNEKIIECIKQILNNPESSKLLEYTANENNTFYKTVFADFLKSLNESVERDNILFATGGQNALCGILLSLFKPGDRIATNFLSFPGLKALAKLLQLVLVPLPEIKGKIDLKGLAQKIKFQKIKGIYLIPDNHNPTTYTLSLSERQAIAEISIENNIFIIEDSINLLFASSKIPSIRNFASNNTIQIVSVSKFLAPGLRVAYIISPENVKSLLEKTFYDFNLMVSPLNLEIVNKILSSNDINKIIDIRKEELMKRNNLVNSILKDYDIRGCQTSMFRWLNLPKQWKLSKFEQECLKNNIKIFTSERFIIDDTQPPNSVRICISSPKNIEELEVALMVIKTILDKKI